MINQSISLFNGLVSSDAPGEDFAQCIRTADSHDAEDSNGARLNDFTMLKNKEKILCEQSVANLRLSARLHCLYIIGTMCSQSS